jgi:hypothetical protein
MNTSCGSLPSFASREHLFWAVSPNALSSSSDMREPGPEFFHFQRLFTSEVVHKP